MFSLLIAARKMSLDAKFIGGEGVDGGQGDGDYMYGKFYDAGYVLRQCQTRREGLSGLDDDYR